MKNPFIPRIREQLSGVNYEPLNKSELAKALRVRSNQRSLYRDALAELEQLGEIERGRKSRYRLVPKGSRNKAPSLIGTIQFSRDRKRQSALFIPDHPAALPGYREGERPKLFVPGRLSGTALDGDKVEVLLVAPEAPRWQRHSKRHRGATPRSAHPPQTKGAHGALPEAQAHAKVIRVVERARTRVVGRFYSKGHRATLVPEDGRLPTSFRLVSVLPEAQPGCIAVAEFLGWDSPRQLPEARMIEVLGNEGDPGVDILSIIHRYGLPLEFPEAVLREAGDIPETIAPEEIARREDWRDREVFTIDPEDAKDFDDAISVSERPDGSWELAVHIADVSHYVKPGTALDKEARRRGNSVYLADRVLPMLPEALSNGVCSLKPGVERLTHAAVLGFDSKGALTSTRFVSAVICSRRRYTYEEAYERMKMDAAAVDALADEGERELVRHLQRAWKLAAQLRQRRFAKGSLDLEFAEVRVVLDEQGRAIGVKRSEYDESHQLIEEFMLAANEAVAHATRQAPVPSLYRVHEDPDPGKLEEFAEQARAFGHRVGDLASNRDEIQRLLIDIRGKLEEHSLKIALLKSLRRAAYSAEPIGHYGLAKSDYTHFTSPIRRYSDLIVHRALRRLLSRRQVPTAPERPDPVPAEGELAQLAEHLSRTERVAADAESDTQRLKMIEYLEGLVGQDEKTVFEATVFEVKPIGAFVEINELYVKGMIRKSALPPWQEYFYDRGREEFRSHLDAPPIRVGTRLQVRLHQVDRERGFLDFAPAGESGWKRRKNRRERPKDRA